MTTQINWISEQKEFDLGDKVWALCFEGNVRCYKAGKIISISENRFTISFDNHLWSKGVRYRDEIERMAHELGRV